MPSVAELDSLGIMSPILVALFGGVVEPIYCDLPS